MTIIASAVAKKEDISLRKNLNQPILLWHKVALSAVLAISVFFNFFALDKQDFFEYYYGAAVKSMLTSWHNFFFASFDPGGFLAIDKPPLGFWVQALSVRLFGFSVFSVLLPEAIAGVLAVALIFHLVRRTFGPLAGLVAALVLAFSPISVVTNRNNIIDSLLILTLLLAVWMVSKAAETGRLRWLCLCAVLVGLGFNIKYLQAYMVVPALGLVYLLGASVRWRKKLCQLALALVILLMLSLSWATIVDLTPASQRPHIDSIATDSELGLALGYNGTFRLDADSQVVDTWAWEIGRPGVTRFFEQPVAGQVSWLLPFALLSLLILACHRKWHLPLNRQQQALVLWGTWLFTMLIFFSSAHFFHLYYLSMLSPAIAALSGAGVVMMWQEYTRRGWRGWLLPYALLMTGLAQVYFLTPFPQWSNMLTVSVIGLYAHLELTLVVMRWRFQPQLRRVARIITSLGLLGLLLAPMVWIVIPIRQAGRAFPMAGPPAQLTRLPPVLVDPVLLDYLLVHKDKARFLFATMYSEEAAPFIMNTGQPVMALGGYNGSHSYLTRDQLIQQINQGIVRFFLMPWSRDPAANWVITHCAVVPGDQWRSYNAASYIVDELNLYNCTQHT